MRCAISSALAIASAPLLSAPVPGARPRLLDVVDGEHAKGDRHAVSRSSPAAARGRTPPPRTRNAACRRESRSRARRSPHSGRSRRAAARRPATQMRPGTRAMKRSRSSPPCATPGIDARLCSKRGHDGVVEARRDDRDAAPRGWKVRLRSAALPLTSHHPDSFPPQARMPRGRASASVRTARACVARRGPSESARRSHRCAAPRAKFPAALVGAGAAHVRVAGGRWRSARSASVRSRGSSGSRRITTMPLPDCAHALERRAQASRRAHRRGCPRDRAAYRQHARARAARPSRSSCPHTSARCTPRCTRSS